MVNARTPGAAVNASQVALLVDVEDKRAEAMQTFRKERAASLLFEEVTLLVQNELEDPRVAALTVTEVSLTKDRRIARIYVTSDNEGDLEQGLAALERARGLIRRRVSELLRWRFAPEVEFRPDRAPQRGARMDELFRALEQEKASRQAAPGEGDGSQPA